MRSHHSRRLSRIAAHARSRGGNHGWCIASTSLHDRSILEARSASLARSRRAAPARRNRMARVRLQAADALQHRRMSEICPLQQMLATRTARLICRPTTGDGTIQSHSEACCAERQRHAQRGESSACRFRTSETLPGDTRSVRPAKPSTARAPSTTATVPTPARRSQLLGDGRPGHQRFGRHQQAGDRVARGGRGFASRTMARFNRSRSENGNVDPRPHITCSTPIPTNTAAV